MTGIPLRRICVSNPPFSRLNRWIAAQQLLGGDKSTQKRDIQRAKEMARTLKEE
jgi:hypothetical protein